MTADDAVEPARRRPRRRPIVPVHYEGWSHFQGDQQSARRTFAAAGLDERVRWATPGSPMPIEC